MITDPINAMINFNYFMMNFSHDFILKCWEDEHPEVVKHISMKFERFYEKKGTALMPFFFCDLDVTNQKKLAKWINKNYLAFTYLEDTFGEENNYLEMKTIADYTLVFKDYGEITVPKGTKLTHNTAMGIDKDYHFVDELSWIDKSYPEVNNILKIDVKNYGIDIPKRYVDKYYHFKIGENYSQKTIGEFSAEHKADYAILTGGAITPLKGITSQVDKYTMIIFIDPNIGYKFIFDGYTSDGDRDFKLDSIKIE